MNMANESRGGACISLGRGMLASLCVTAAGMVILSLMVVYAGIRDGALLSLNQVLKLAAIFTGAWIAVGRGGTRGFVLGAVLGLVYIALGYGVCALWEGELDVTGGMLALEMALGLLLGGVSGALAANMPAKKGKRKG